jgi:hypothetical protein
MTGPEELVWAARFAATGSIDEAKKAVVALRAVNAGDRRSRTAAQRLLVEFREGTE